MGEVNWDTIDLSKKEADMCTCGLIGPWRRIRAHHLTICELGGKTEAYPEQSTADDYGW